ncbi:MAG: CocE/NonD family hydrolase [Gemmatimonadaceae bacterium]|nr:CocE/NonD family hydrolase [Gemmatimonadaceae bacterium]
MSSPMRRRGGARGLAMLLLATGALPAGGGAQQSGSAAETAYIREHYTKREVVIPVRDGTKLYTIVYTPRDTTRRYPILLNRTPYSIGPYGGSDTLKATLGPSFAFVKAGYIFAYQDVRGAYMSEGRFVNMTPHRESKPTPQETDESTDTWDSIDWLLKFSPHNNGRVGTWGISYPGFYTAAGMIDAHPAHRAASPQAPIADWFAGDDFHRNGVLWLPHFFGFISGFGKPRPVPTPRGNRRFAFPTADGYDFFLNDLGPVGTANAKFFHDSVAFWNEALAHPTYDQFWQSRNLRPHLRRIRPAVMTVGGFFDAENVFGALQVYRSVEAQSPDASNTLVMGPWFHGGWARSNGLRLGDAYFGSATSEWYRDSVEFPFFEYHLRDVGNDPRSEAIIFDSGRNAWTRLDAWPPRNAGAQALHLGPGGVAAFTAPPTAARATFDRYVSDPAKPVPFTQVVATGMPREYMTEDQRFASRRPDVLVYQTAPLTDDLTVMGPVGVDLVVSTSGTDADFVVKVIDVFPDSAPAAPGDRAGFSRGGYQMLLRGEPFRAQFRDSYERPSALVPNTPVTLRWQLNDIAHTFRRGHRIMVHVQGTWFPLMERNPQVFSPNIAFAAPSDFRAATMRVYHSSRLLLPVVR